MPHAFLQSKGTPWVRYTLECLVFFGLGFYQFNKEAQKYCGIRTTEDPDKVMPYRARPEPFAIGKSLNEERPCRVQGNAWPSM